MLLTTRAATTKDRPFLRATHHDAYRDVTLRQFGVWDVPQQDEYFDASWRLGGLEVILVDGEPCGYCQVEMSIDDFHVRELVLAPKFQQQGIGSEFLRTLQGLARSRAVPIRLGTLHQNRAVALYRRLGFTELSRTETHILMEWSPRSNAAP